MKINQRIGAKKCGKFDIAENIVADEWKAQKINPRKTQVHESEWCDAPLLCMSMNTKREKRST